VERFFSEHPSQVRLRLAVQGRDLYRLDEPGVSRARNRGAGRATADWFATLDDDAVSKAGWLDNALQICRSVTPDVRIVQGRVNPLWPGSTSPNLGRLWRDCLSIVQLNEDGDMTDTRCVQKPTGW
jgi:hypothetical protein